MARNLYGTDNSEILHGTSGHWPDGDAIWGYGGDDEIYAGDGWDYLTGGFGADYLDGGGAFDQAIYADSPVGVTVFLSPGLGLAEPPRATCSSISRTSLVRSTTMCSVATVPAMSFTGAPATIP